MKTLTMIAAVLLIGAEAQAEKAPTAIDMALLDTITEHQLQQKTVSDVLYGEKHPQEILELTGEPQVLHITTGTGMDILAPAEAPPWNVDDTDGPQLAF